MEATENHTRFYQGLIYLYAWLSGNVGYFGDEAGRLPTIEQWLDHCYANGDNPSTANQHYTLVQVIKDDVLVATGFFQCSGTNVVIHLLGVKNGYQFHGIGNKLMAWYLSSLPATAAAGTVTLDTLESNANMRRWCARFGGTETIRESEGDMVIAFNIATACSVFGIPMPSNPDYHFREQFGDLVFHVVYAGVHPNFVDPEKPPIAQAVIPVM